MISIMPLPHYVITRPIMFTHHVFTVTAPKELRSQKKEAPVLDCLDRWQVEAPGSVIISPSVNRIK